MLRNWFRTIWGVAPRQPLTPEVAELLEEQKRLQHLQACWERGETIELQIGPPGYPDQQMRVVTDCNADDAHLVSAPLNQLVEQNELMLHELTLPTL